MKRLKVGSNQHISKRRSHYKGWLFYYTLFVVLIVMINIAPKLLAKNVPTASAETLISPLPQEKVHVAGQSAQRTLPTPTVTPTPTHSEDPDRAYIFNQKHGDIIWHIYGLESTWGRAYDGCRTHGQVNGFGYAQTDDHSMWNCYTDRHAVVDAVETWLENKLDVHHMSLRDALCIYNRGTASLCPYAEHFLDLSTN